MNQSSHSQSQEETSTGIDNELVLTPNIPDGDGFYDELLMSHENLSKEDSDAFNARLVLLLCNHIGDRDIIRQALKAAAPLNPIASK